MTSPYRDGSGPPCPRCGVALAPDADGDLACTDGCGVWIAKAALETLLGTADLRTGRIPYWKATPLPETKCITCQGRLDDLYAELNHRVLALGRCAQHGVWVEHGTRAELEAAYPRHAPVALRPAEERIAQLEKRVAELEEVVSDLSAHVRWRRWNPDDA